MRRFPIDIATRLASALAGRYTIDREIGRGGMATVYLAHDVRHDRRVAIKVLVDSVTSAVGSERFLREIHIASALTHPHILTVHDSGEADELLYCVMPFVDGESLRARMVRERQLPIEDSIQITREIADALAYAHAHGVVHRDIKPENILLSGGHALVCDFGIARALTGTGAGERRLTDSGTSVGTPLYMSPEQAAGDSDIDGRADLYALGCVCFEMLTGMPPFTGVNAQVVRMRHVAEPPPPIRTMRPTVPREIEEVVHRLMAKVPADRFPSAARLRDTLSSTANEGKAVTRSRRRWWQLGALVGFLALAVGVVLGVRGIDSFTSLGGIEPDSSRYAVLPLMEIIEDGPLPADLSGARVARDMADALGDWRGIEVVRDFRVRDLLNRSDRPPRTMQATAGFARQLRAGVVIWGDVRAATGGADVRAVMYRSTDPDEVIAQHRVFVPAGGAVRDSMVALLASLLTSRGGVLQNRPSTRDYTAYSAYSRGREALAEWDLPRALRELEHAVQLDPKYPEAHLWFAIVQTWAGEDNPRQQQWRVSARFAAELVSELPHRDRPLARAMASMADSRYDVACALFDSLVGSDSTSFEGWYGLGHCLQADPTVVPDRASPSGHRFRTSWERALEAYTRALELVPSAHLAFRGSAYERLPRRLFLAEPNTIRPGLLPSGQDTIRFAAFAQLDADTIAFIPYQSAELFAGQSGPPPAAIAAAAAHNRERLRLATTNWVRAFPSSADAREMLAKALEAIGEISESGHALRSATVQLREARALATDLRQQQRLAIAQARLLLKQGQFTNAARIADSILIATADTVSDAAQVGDLASLAALRGDAALASAILHRAAHELGFATMDGRWITVHRPLSEPALTYLAYSAVGAPAETLLALERTVEQAIDRFADATQRPELRTALLMRPATLAYPVAGPMFLHNETGPGSPLMLMQRHLTNGDTVSVRTQLDRLVRMREALRPGDVSIDQILLESLLRLAITDTAEAVALLDRSLGALPTLGLGLLQRVPEAAGLVRAMELRSDLADRRGEITLSRHWRGAVTALQSKPGSHDR